MATEKLKVPFFKRWYVMLIVGIIIGGIAFSGGGTETATEPTITDEASVEATEEVTAEPKEETPAPTPEKEPTKVWENEQVIISFKEVSSEGVKFLVENKSDKTVLIQADSVAVNGFSSNDIIMSDSISPKSKGYAEAQTSELADVGEAKTVSGNLRVIDNDTYDTVNATFTDITIK